MKAPKIDQAARRDIDKLVARILRDAGFQEPPIEMNDVLSTLKLDREFFMTWRIQVCSEGCATAC